MGGITAIQLGERMLAVVAGKPAPKGVELTHAGTAPLPEGYASLEGEARTAALRQALDAAGAAGHKCILVVPRSLAILRTFAVPTGTPEELQNMIRFQLEKDLPLPLEQVRYAVESRIQDGKVQVTAAAVPNEALDKRIADLEEAGFHVTAAVVTSFGLLRIMPPPGPDGGSLLLSLYDGVAEILVAESSRLQLSRTTPLRDENPENWAAEVDRAILTYNARGEGAQLTKVLVAGTGDPADQFVTELKRRLQGVSVNALVPNGTVTRRADVVITAEASAAAGVVAGWFAGALPDLLKRPVVRRTMKFKRAHKIGAAAGFLVLAILVGSQVALAGRKSEIASIRKEIEALKPKADKVDRMNGEIGTLQQWHDRRFAWIDLFAQLQQRLSHAKVHLASFNADESGGVRLSGKSKDPDAALQVASELQKLGAAFLEVGSPQIRLNSDKSEYKHDFDIKVTLSDLAPKKVVKATKK
jgi:hypothetical protein